MIAAEEESRLFAAQDPANSLVPGTPPGPPLSARWAQPVDSASPPSPEAQVDVYEQERLDLQAILKAAMAHGLKTRVIARRNEGIGNSSLMMANSTIGTNQKKVLIVRPAKNRTPRRL